MSTRDELDEIHTLLMADARKHPVYANNEESALYGYSEGAEHALDTVRLKGYVKPRQVSSVEELDALPDGVLVLTEQGGYWESIKRMDGKNWWKEPGATNVSPSSDLTLPATVLHEAQS